MRIVTGCVCPSVARRQLLAFVLEIEAVARLDLDGGDTLRAVSCDRRLAAEVTRLIELGGTRCLHRRSDAATGLGDFLIGRTFEALFEFRRAVAAIDRDECGSR